MTSLQRVARLCFVAAMFGLSGCSWFKHKPSAEPAAAADASAAAPADAPAASEPEPPATPSQGPAAVALDFYTMHQRLGNSGLPARSAMNAYNAFLCPSLADAIEKARQRQQQFIASNPDDKPPFIEGDLFSSLFEGPDAIKPGDAVIEGMSARVPLAMSRSEGEGGKTVKWSDTAVLELDDGIWCLADVEYRGQWPFANKGRLGDSLKADF